MHDVWHDSAEPVTVEMVIRTLAANINVAQDAISILIREKAQWDAELKAHNGMKEALALVGDWDSVDGEVKTKLDPIIGDYLPD